MTEVVARQTPPILHGPTDKERKYDRQLRLWAASGQAALESANILLVNSGAGCVGIETLKNLVLPGIGRFTIADDAVVKQADLGLNFFLDKECLGKSRSECCTRLLRELNPEVQGDWFPKTAGPLDLKAVLDTAPTYTLILYTHPIQEKDLELIKAYEAQHQTPVVSIHSAGFYSYFKIDLPGTFPVVDTHPDVEKTTDLRLLQPWPELLEFSHSMTQGIDALNDHDHGHLPYVVILLYYLDQWRKSHQGQNPVSTSEKKEFRKLILESARTNNPEGGEENFTEAEAAVNKNIVVSQLEEGVRQIFDHPVTGQVEQRSAFWMIAKAVKVFYEEHGCLPLPGALPDMKAQSNVYVKLQSIYKEKARKDAAEVLSIVQTIPGGDTVDPGEVELFCKNARFIKLINATAKPDSLTEVFSAEKVKDEEAKGMMEATDGTFRLPMSNFFIYLALVATSQNPEASASDITGLTDETVPQASEYERFAKISEEVARAAGGELHNISALTGGMVAQETIKIITKQYVPIDNTCILDGVSSRCQVLRL